MTAPPVRWRPRRLFFTGLALTFGGALVFIAGMGNAFSRMHGWWSGVGADLLALLGIVLMIAGGLCILVAFVRGARLVLRREGAFPLWWVYSLLGVALLGYVLWVVIHL